MKKPFDEPMRLEDIETLLLEAAKLTNHRNFVIVGSLSGIGSLINPPEEMVMSRDIDLFTKTDPDRVFMEIGQSLNEKSKFAMDHGFYADPVSCKIISAPEGWQERLIPIPVKNGIVAWFMDTNDAACAKAIRWAENDEKWIKSAVENGAANLEIIEQRLGYCENTIENEIDEARARIASLFKGRKRKP